MRVASSKLFLFGDTQGEKTTNSVIWEDIREVKITYPHAEGKKKKRKKEKLMAFIDGQCRKAIILFIDI